MARTKGPTFAVCEPTVKTGVEGETGDIWRYLPDVFYRPVIMFWDLRKSRGKTYGEKWTVKAPLDITDEPSNPQKGCFGVQRRIRFDEVVNLVLADEMRDGVFVVCETVDGRQSRPDVVC